MRHHHLMIVLLGFASQTGCASVGVRLGGYTRQAAIYPATSVDIGLISHVAKQPCRASDPTSSSVDAQAGLVYLLVPGAIVDLPMAVVLDTLMLAYDLQKARSKQADSIPRDSAVETTLPE
jgi:uncharacterized protein YceK